jgi:hypothetical protein
MNDAVDVRQFQRGTDVSRDAGRSLHGEPAFPFHQLPQGFGEPFEDDESGLVFRLDVYYLHDIRMLQMGCGAGIAEKPLHNIGFSDPMRFQFLDGHGTQQDLISGQVHSAEETLAFHFLNDVAPKQCVANGYAWHR